MKNALLAVIFTFGAFLAAPSTSQAVVLDWDTATWNPEGALVQATHAYDVDPSFAGNDIQVNISGYIGQLYTNSPRVSSELTGGFTPAQNALIINTNHENTATYVTITIDFYNPAGVINPTFSIFDIDTGLVSGAQFTWQDQISNIQASFGAVTYTPTFSNLGSAVTTVGSSTLLGTTNVDETNGNGNATISFTGGPVSRIQFDYRPGPASISNPDGQVIALGDITFNDLSAIPEINSLWVALGALVLAAMFQKLRQRSNSAYDLVASQN